MSMKILENPTVQNAGIATMAGAGIGAIGSYLVQDYTLKNPAKVLDSYTKAMVDVATRETKSATLRKIYDASGKRILENFNAAVELINSGKINNKILGMAAVKGAVVGASVYALYRGIKALFTPKNN